MQHNDQKSNLFKYAKRIMRTNEDITGKQYIRNDDGVLVVSDKNEKMTCKSYHEKLLITEFAQDRNRLFQTDIVSYVPHLIDKDMVRKPISKIKNGKAAGSSGVVSQMEKAAEEAGIDIITDLVNQTIVEGVIPAEQIFALLLIIIGGKTILQKEGTIED